MDAGQFVRVGSEDELQVGKPAVKSILGKKVGVFKRDDGSVYALELTCKHQGADLSGGEIVDGLVTCPRHGWTYDLSTGECISHPTGLPLRFHQVEVEDGKVSVSLMASPSKGGSMPWD